MPKWSRNRLAPLLPPWDRFLAPTSSRTQNRPLRHIRTTKHCEHCRIVRTTKHCEHVENSPVLVHPDGEPSRTLKRPANMFGLEVTDVRKAQAGLCVRAIRRSRMAGACFAKDQATPASGDAVSKQRQLHPAPDIFAGSKRQIICTKQPWAISSRAYCLSSGMLLIVCFA